MWHIRSAGRMDFAFSRDSWYSSRRLSLISRGRRPCSSTPMTAWYISYHHIIPIKVQHRPYDPIAFKHTSGPQSGMVLFYHRNSAYHQYAHCPPLFGICSSYYNPQQDILVTLYNILRTKSSDIQHISTLYKCL